MFGLVVGLVVVGAGNLEQPGQARADRMHALIVFLDPSDVRPEIDEDEQCSCKRYGGGVIYIEQSDMEA